MSKPYPPEFRRDVVGVARKGEAPLTQITKDFGISEGCVHNWMKKADIEEGARPGLTTAEAAELRDARDGPARNGGPPSLPWTSSTAQCLRGASTVLPSTTKRSATCARM